MAIDKELRKALVDRLTGDEIVEYLQIDTDYVIELFEDEIMNNLDEIKELAGLPVEDNDNE